MTEKDLLDARDTNGPNGRQEEEKTTESSRLSRMSLPDVIGEDALCLILQHVHWLHVVQTRSLCPDE